jgi:putative protein-disulfide isomerase
MFYKSSLAALLAAVFIFITFAFQFRERSTSEKPELIYVGDAMCSWCYGFSPEISAVKDHFKDAVEFKLLNGGLRPYARNAMDAEMKKFLRQHWKEVTRLTGQSFSYSILDDSSTFVYNTEPPARAIATVRKLKPGAEFDFFKQVQNAFYVKNRNTSDIATYLELLSEFSIDPETFKSLYNSEEMKQVIAEEFKKVETLGVRGFPALLLHKDGQYIRITDGYAKRGEVIKSIEKVLNKK